MSANAAAPETAEGRAAERSNMFVVATLSCAAGSTPVRVRNLSPSGALVEGSVLPLAGARMRLSRGNLHSAGEVVWSADGRAGLRFSGAISVADWMPGGGASRSRQRADEVVFNARPNASAGFNAPLPAAGAPSVEVAMELSVLADRLTRLCGQLADDPRVAAAFPEALLTIEATALRLERLADLAVKADRAAG
jgi:hypothetical protein